MAKSKRLDYSEVASVSPDLNPIEHLQELEHAIWRWHHSNLSYTFMLSILWRGQR